MGLAAPGYTEHWLSKNFCHAGQRQSGHIHWYLDHVFLGLPRPVIELHQYEFSVKFELGLKKPKKTTAVGPELWLVQCWPIQIKKFCHINCLSALFPKGQLKIQNFHCTYRKTSNIRCTLIGNKIVDHSDVVGAAPTTSSFSTLHLASRDPEKTAARQYENLLSVGIWCGLY